jgi:PAS domain S-box-containing protein
MIRESGGEDGARDIHTEIRNRFGVLPNFFRLTSENPEITTNLWGFARFAYLDNPLPSLFKERLFVYLSRFCDVRYCISRHVGFLIGLGRPAGDAQSPIQTIEEIVRLVRRPLPRSEHIQPHVALCAACDQPLVAIPEPESSMEEAIFACATHAFLQTPQTPQCLAGLKRALGSSLFEHLLVFLAFVRTAHYWTRVHTELEVEQDIRDLLATHEALAECVLNDPETSGSELSQQLIDELAQLREAKRRLSAESQQHLEQAQLSQQQADVAHADLAMLYGVTDALNRSDSLERALDIALEGISRVLKVERSSILLHDSSRTMRFVAWRGLSDEYRRAVDGHTPWPPDTKDPPALYIDDVDAEPSMSAYLPMFRKEGIRALGFVPLMTSGALCGKFMIYSPTPRVFTERERNLAGSVATQLAFVIERRRAERERLEAMLAAEALGKRLQIITDAVPVLIAYVDREERHRYASKAFENWFGISPEKMQGKSLRELLGDVVYEAIRPHVAKALSGEEITFDVHGAVGTAEPRWLRATYVPQRNPNGEVDGFVALAVDISAQKQADAAREALVSNLERTIAFSERFAGILGHDLRNPLNAIQNSAQLLSRRATTPDALRIPQRIVASAERMSRMITELLDFTRTRIGSGIPLSPTRSDLLAICTTAVEELETGRPEAAITVDRQGDTRGTWDQDRLAQVFSNIVGKRSIMA